MQTWFYKKYVLSLCIYLFIYMSVYISFYLSGLIWFDFRVVVHLSIYNIYLYIYKEYVLSLCICVEMIWCSSGNLSIYLSSYLSIYLSVCLSIFLSIWVEMIWCSSGNWYFPKAIKTIIIRIRTKHCNFRFRAYLGKGGGLKNK